MDLTPRSACAKSNAARRWGNGWDPQHHQPTDVYSTYNDDDFRLGLNAAQTTSGSHRLCLQLSRIRARHAQKFDHR
jgi:hypothetical protein